MRLIIFLILGVMAGSISASAQSVLERVLGQIDGATNLAQVNGTYANIAESVLGTNATSELVYTPNGSEVLYQVELDKSAADGRNQVPFLTVTQNMLGTSGTVAYDALNNLDPSGPWKWDYSVKIDGSIEIKAYGTHGYFQIFPPGVTPLWKGVATGLYNNLETFRVYAGQSGTNTIAYADGAEYFSDGAGGNYFMLPSIATSLGYAAAGQIETTVTYTTHVIDGSITNIITGVTSATQEAVAGVATATEVNLPTFDLGDMATTALGAVNTGEITLGVNSAVDEAKTSSTRAISAVMTQIGGSADTGALVLNVASNASAVNGSIENVMMAVNGSIGSASTTALGAVNTGTITSGVNAAVQGIVGLSGQSASGL
jgi:hypothetical protein|tara:strand:- start:719 stop:1837 length:1119 start_codon:yes stop_codon:yes gene_type:complete